LTLRRLSAVVVIVLLGTLLALAGALWVVIDTGAARTWAETAVERATGHALRIAGTVHFTPSLVPTLAVADVALLNPPGFSRPDLAHARRVETRVALLPLLRGRIEVRRLRVVGLDAKLEVNAAGQGNWQRPPVPTSTPVAPGEHRRFAMVLRQVEVDDSTLAWSGPGGPLRLDVPRLSAEGKDTLKLGGTLRAGAVSLQVQGAVVPAAPWPTYVALTSQGVSLALHAQGGEVGVAGAVNAAALDPRLATLGTVKLDIAWSPGAAHLHAEAAPFTLGSGLHVEQLALDAPALDQPVRAHATLTGAARLSLDAETGPPAAMLTGTPLPVAVAASGQGGTAKLQGTLSDPKRLRGLDAVLSLQVADLAALAPGAPPLHDAALAARLTDLAGLFHGIAIQDLSARVPKGDLAGNLAVSWQPRPALRGAFVSKHLDADALLALFREHPTPAATAPAPRPAPTPSPARTRLIPGTPVPVTGLRAADADLSYAAEALSLGGSEFHAVQAHVGLANGTLRLDPLTATSPGGPVQARAVLDAAALPPRLSLALHAPSLALAGFLPGAAGTVAVRADLSGQGATWRQVAASLGGEADLTGVDGEFDLDALAPLREALHRAGVPAAISGQAHLRCVAFRAVATSGVATLNPVLLDAGQFGLRGHGQVDLRDEVPDLHLRALVRFGPADAEVPLRVTGTLAQPKVAAEAVGGRFGLMPAGRARDDCGPALADARGGRPGPEPAPLPNPPPAGRAERPADLLRSLLR
jgi:uncharacterized protein involved in outer membrane biogenesis